jgi:DNA polymerase elongation subunit (family B)
MQKILVFDIETSDMLVSTFGIRDQFIADDQIVRDLRLLAVGAKWLGKPVMYREARKESQEKALLRWVWNLLDKADIVIGHNSKNFDSKVLTARFIAHGMTPPSPYRHLDTLHIYRSVAKAPSHKLSYLTKTVNSKYKKLDHSEFPGRTLWLECMAGNKRAWEVMKKYNIHDVLSTEEFYLNIRPWIPASMPAAYVLQDPEVECDKCGSHDVNFNGYYYKKSSKHRRIHCKECGGWTIGAKVRGL